MKIIVTCGPSYEPIDQARRITNFSTGRLGITLANAFAARGWDVLCLKGEQATCPDPLRGARVEVFTTNQDLADRLEVIRQRETIAAIFHAAALCDFRVDQVLDESGRRLDSPKFATRDGRLHLVLAPTIKVLPRLREWFPRARIVGWKYELAGMPADALAKAWRQVDECHIDACVLNGAAYGPGFAICTADRSIHPCADNATLAQWLGEWLHANSAKD